MMTDTTEKRLQGYERTFSVGMTSAELLDACERLNVPMSEASLRKYVQLGLLPRSTRVGRKGKHRGSQGLYPVSALRQILRIKEMMADNYTIEQIQRDFFFVRRDLQQLQEVLHTIFSTLSGVLQDQRRSSYAQDIGRDLEGAKQSGSELVSRLEAIESRLITRARLQRVGA